MFKRILHEDWATIIPIFAFVVMFTVFLVTTIRAVCLKPAERRRLASLPLESRNND